MSNEHDAFSIPAGTTVFYVCAVQPTDKRLLPHPVLAGPFTTEAAARAAAPEAFQGSRDWHWRDGATIGVVTIPQPWHRGALAQITHGAYVLPTPCEACLIAEPDTNLHMNECPEADDAAHGWC